MTTQSPGPGTPPASVDDGGRPADWLELIELLVVLIIAAAYVYVIGWVITWVRLSAAHLPVDASLPVTANQVVFLAGLRLVVVMAIVFGAMCAVAWAVHAWTWTHRAPEWHSVIKHGRVEAAKRHQRVFRHGSVKQALAFSSSPPPDLQPAPVGDTYVRIIAGFDVGVIAATFGLAAARVLKSPIDQAFPPGPWWDLLAPWALVTGVLSLVLAWLGPVWGSRLFHAVLWAVVVVVALVSDAPTGVLLFTWAGVATLGRAYGRARSSRNQGVLASGHPRHLSFALSPLPWLLLTVYALVGIAYYGQPPVTFSRTTVTTPSGVRVGGYHRAYQQRPVSGLVHAARRRDVDQRGGVGHPVRLDRVGEHEHDGIRGRLGSPSVAAVGPPARFRHRCEHARVDPAGGARGPADLRR